MSTSLKRGCRFAAPRIVLVLLLDDTQTSQGNGEGISLLLVASIYPNVDKQSFLNFGVGGGVSLSFDCDDDDDDLIRGGENRKEKQSWGVLTISPWSKKWKKNCLIIAACVCVSGHAKKRKPKGALCQIYMEGETTISPIHNESLGMNRN
jgi:hypothetical protein